MEVLPVLWRRSNAYAQQWRGRRWLCNAGAHKVTTASNGLQLIPWSVRCATSAFCRARFDRI
jgi:hypothetical protein